MARISGVDIPNEKKVEYSLRYIYGVGPFFSVQILKEAGVDRQTKTKELTEDQLSRIASVIDRSYVVEGNLRRQVQQNIARLRDIGCYRGIRHRRDLRANEVRQ